MPKSLPSPWRLIADTWLLYIKTWNDTIKVSIWFLYAGLVYFAVYLAIKLVPAMVFIGIFVAFGILFVWSWTIIRLIQTIIRIEDGKTPELSREAMNADWGLVLPLLWVGILQVLVILGASVPLVAWRILVPLYGANIVGPVVYYTGVVLLVIPPVYAIIRLCFSQLAAIDGNKRGIEALASSSEMVRGNWIAICLRQLTAGVVFGVGIWLVLSLLFLALGIIVGPEKFLLLADPSNEDPLLRGIISLLEGIVQAALMPLAMIFTVKLYRAVRRAK